MVKLTGSQLDELLGITCGEKLVEDLDPWYGAVLTLGSLDQKNQKIENDIRGSYDGAVDIISVSDLEIYHNCETFLVHPSERGRITWSLESNRLGGIWPSYNFLPSSLGGDEKEIGCKAVLTILRTSLKFPSPYSNPNNPFENVKVGGKSLWCQAHKNFLGLLLKYLASRVKFYSDKNYWDPDKAYEKRLKSMLSEYKKGHFIGGVYNTGSHRDPSVRYLILTL